MTDGDDLKHYGILRKSGRYPWGSGDDPHQRANSFVSTIAELRKQGLKDTEIAKRFGMNSTQLRETTTLARAAKRSADRAWVTRLKNAGNSNVAISRRTGIPEPTVRVYLKENQADRINVIDETTKLLREQVAQKKYIDVGVGTERHQGISREKMKTAIGVLKDEGYTIHYVPVPQIGTKHKTTVTVLAGKDADWSEVWANRDHIQQIQGFSNDGGRTFSKIQPPISIDSKRVKVRYAEQGGKDADGVIYVRPGVKDLTLGGAQYAQVRIAIDGTHYLKGMAVYHPNLPKGADLLFNTNKSDTGNPKDAMKPMKDDPTNPFGAVVRQLPKLDEHGREIKNTVRSAMNIVNSEGAWGDWSSTLSAQMLSKQSPQLAKEQLDKAYDRKVKQLEEIRSTTNPAVKQKLLEDFAESADSGAIHLKAAAMDRQGSHVILPVPTMKEHEIYAPNYHNGEKVVLIRYPHGGIFEIPELTVNNRHPDARAMLGDHPKDAVGIHPKVAERLSGADFDGDSVLVIPNPHGKIKNSPPLEGLKGFDPQAMYPGYEGMPEMSSRTKGMQMGLVSNLITDMTVMRASHEELARAVRHSMVVIDAEKHKLNWRQSAIDNGIPALMKKYQKRSQGGASTVISNSNKATVEVNERIKRKPKDGGPIDPVTGELRYTETGAKYIDKKTGKEVIKKDKVSKIGEVKDAHQLSSGTLIESIYADHSNRMKALANQARLDYLRVQPAKYDPQAKKKYASQVARLDAKLNLALRNSPLERQAQIFANATLRAKKAANPDMDEAELKKVKFMALEAARAATGAKKPKIQIEPDEWEAIQAGAITHSKLKQILNNSDMEKVKELSMPKEHKVMSASQKSRAQGMLDNGRTMAEVASALGVTLATLKRNLYGGE
jgi:hypothetical protein